MAGRAGGRGRKADYETTHVRVPIPCKDDVMAVIEAFHRKQSIDTMKPLPTVDEAKAIAKHLVTHKKSARVTVSKLLTAIYGENVEL